MTGLNPSATNNVNSNDCTTHPACLHVAPFSSLQVANRKHVSTRLTGLIGANRPLPITRPHRTVAILGGHANGVGSFKLAVGVGHPAVEFRSKSDCNSILPKSYDFEAVGLCRGCGTAAASSETSSRTMRSNYRRSIAAGIAGDRGPQIGFVKVESNIAKNPRPICDIVIGTFDEHAVEVVV